MTDDELIEWLLVCGRIGEEPVLFEAASRIKKLRAALREIAAGYETPWSTSTVSNMLNVAEILSDRINIARKALEGKDE